LYKPILEPKKRPKWVFGLKRLLKLGNRSGVRSKREELVEAAARARRLYPRRGYKGLDTTSLQVLLALALADGTPCSSESIAARLALDPSTVSHAIASLCQRNLAARTASEADGRRRSNRITNSGLRLLRTWAAKLRVDERAKPSPSGPLALSLDRLEEAMRLAQGE